jgi:uncharacterized protein (DUF58 family)
MFDFEAADKEDLSKGPSRPSVEGKENLLDHRWVWMALLVFIFGALIRNASMVAITGFMLVIIVFSWNWNRRALHNIYYLRRFHHRRAFPGEKIEVQILVENRKWLPVTWLQIEDEWPSEFAPEDESALVPSAGGSIGYLVNVYSLRWNERVRRRYTLLAQRRGIFHTGPAHLLTGDPFSLFQDGTTSERSETLIIYPKVLPLDQLGLDAKDPFGEVGTQQRLFEDPNRIMGIREYRNDDSFRHVHWKATARTGSLQVKQYEPTRTRSVVLCLNIASFEQHTLGVWPAMVEYLISTAASIASWAVEQEYAVGLIANAALAQTDRPLRTQPGRSRNQLANLLEAMAGISYFITHEYSRFLLRESSSLPWSATLVAMTGFTTDPILGSLLRLRQSGRRIVLVDLGKTPPPYLPGITTHHLPISDDAPDPDELVHMEHTEETPRQRYLRQQAEREQALEL